LAVTQTAGAGQEGTVVTRCCAFPASITLTLVVHTRAREEDAADREADLVRGRLLQGKRRDADEPDRPLKPTEKGFRCSDFRLLALGATGSACTHYYEPSGGISSRCPTTDVVVRCRMARLPTTLNFCMLLQVQRCCARQSQAQLQARPGLSHCTGSQCGLAWQVSWHAVRSHDEKGMRPKLFALRSAPQSSVMGLHHSAW
jgi:hypothetical protein